MPKYRKRNSDPLLKWFGWSVAIGGVSLLVKELLAEDTERKERESIFRKFEFGLNDFYGTDRIKCPTGLPDNNQIHISDIFKSVRGAGLHTGVDIDLLNRLTNINSMLDGEIVDITIGQERGGKGVWFEDSIIKTYENNLPVMYQGDDYFQLLELGRNGKVSPFGNSITVKSYINRRYYYIRYMHMSFFERLFKGRYRNEADKIIYGDFLRAGNTLGKAGATGNATGLHLHLEVYSVYKEGERPNMKPEYCLKNGKCVDRKGRVHGDIYYIEPNFFLNAIANTFYQI